MILKRSTLFLLLIAALAACVGLPETSASSPDTDAATSQTAHLKEQRESMVREGIIGFGIESETVIKALRETPRHEFVPEEFLDQAYANHPLPIGFGQTISQPYIVALMSQELGVAPGEKVLEVGTGSGYQAAVLAEMGLQVYSMEIIEPLAERAQARLQELGYEQVQVRNADGYYGWPEEAPFDGILVTAAPDHVPQPLLRQLNVGAVMVIPVGPVGGYQELWKIKRVSEEEFKSESLGGVRFVPLTRSEKDE
ncbi:MAG: protein-L-isoaspartate(D-aspartate) O-methyltransferase [Anaerolineales bacterium]|jgi:protein-L-isoaspartate(D-aspartate) O-methyltransferase